VTLPTITSAELPQQAVDKLSKALGVTLPSNFGQITLVRSANLNAAQRGVKAFDRLAIALPFVTVALIALTLWLSLGRRRTLVQLLVGTLLLMIVVRRVVIHEQGALANSAHNPQVAQLVTGRPAPRILRTHPVDPVGGLRGPGGGPADRSLPLGDGLPLVRCPHRGTSWRGR
jgi:hypothetical protein